MDKEYPHSTRRERRAFEQRAPHQRAIEWRNRGHTGGTTARSSDANAVGASTTKNPRATADAAADPSTSTSPSMNSGASATSPGSLSDTTSGGESPRRRADRDTSSSNAAEHNRARVGVSRRSRHRRTSILVIVMVAVLGVGAGAFAAFFSSESSTVSVGAGEVDVEWSTSVSSSLAVPISSILPGQTVERLVELRNTGSLAISDLQLVITAANADNSDGLQLAISDCSVPWSGSTSFTCGGVETVVSADRPVRAVVALPALGTRQAGGNDFLRMTFRLPASAPVSLQYSSTTVNFEILGNHGVGVHR